jgi:hypothetical protein
VSRIEAETKDIRKPCPHVGESGCNPECYHATDHGHNGQSCHMLCPLVAGAMCGGVR